MKIRSCEEIYENEIVKNKEKLEIFREMLLEYNQKYNLTTILEEKDVYFKHFLDSALAGEFITKGNLLDVGSGGGFPAIPLKIMNDDINLTMLEATEKKCNFF